MKLIQLSKQKYSKPITDNIFEFIIKISLGTIDTFHFSANLNLIYSDEIQTKEKSLNLENNVFYCNELLISVSYFSLTNFTNSL